MRAVATDCLLLAACAQPPTAAIYGSSADAFARTAETARRHLPVADRLDSDRAIATVSARRYGNRDPSAVARVTFDGTNGARAARR